MTQAQKKLIAFSTVWGTKFGGINSFNMDLLAAFAAHTYRVGQTLCIVPFADADDIQDALTHQVTLISMNCRNEHAFGATAEAQAWEALQDAGVVMDATQTVWLGHDRISGAIALAAAKKRGGRAALIHHMSYTDYEFYAETSAAADKKTAEQKMLFEQADVALAVGPLLRDALADMLGRETVPMLVPGLPDIEVKRAPNTFTAFLSGRLNEDAKKIKQAYLGVAAFADAIRQADAATALPEVLRSERGPKLTLRGVDFDNQDKNSGKPDGDAEQALRLFAEGYAKGVVPMVALPFTTERKVLFDGLRAASVAMMPSWHEGFGLVAWEAIGAGVPLIISKKSGVHRLLQEVDDGMYTSLYTAIDIKGSNRDPYFQDADLAALATQIIHVAAKGEAFKGKAAQLRENLARLYGWPQCAKQLSDALGWEIDLIDLIDLIDPAQTAQTEAAPTPRAGQPQAALLELPRPHWRFGQGLSESLLLRAEEAVIPFDPNRDAFLDLQLDWARATDYPITVRLLTGAGGTGKTRLALELCHRLQREGWQAGFAGDDFNIGKASALGVKLGDAGQDCCVVLDYAEARQDVLLALLQAVLTKKEKNDKPARHKIRIMLLARDSGEWWDLLPSKNQACEALLSGMAGSGPFTMPDLHDSLADRQQAYQLALRTFADRLHQTAPAHTPRLDDAHFALPLSIQMAALLALRGERPISAQALTRALVNRERRYWRRNALSGLPGNPEIHEQQAALLMALATLGNGIAGLRGFEALWAKAGGDKALLKPLLHLLTPLYPSHYQGLQGLRPDLLGEALVEQVILGANNAELLSAVLGQADQTGRHASLSVLARLLGKREDIGRLFEDALVGHFSNCAHDLIAVCIQTPGPLPRMAENAFARLERAAKWQAGGILASYVHLGILPLAGLDVLVWQESVAKARQKLGKQTADSKAEYARALINLSLALDRNGQNDTALETAKQAVDIYQRLALAKPGRFEPDLAASLNNYAEFLSDQGDGDAALRTAKQALDIYQRLALAKPERFEPDLAMSLSNYANHLADQGDGDAALRTAKQALDIYQWLALAKPERFEPDLATSLNNCANHLADQGDGDAALRTAKQALDIRQRLALAKPERFEPDLAMSLSNYANRLAEQGDGHAALRTTKQALDIYQRLALAKPERFEPDLAKSLSNYAIRLSDQGDGDAALRTAKQALDIRQRLALAKPERFEPDLATSLSNYAIRLSDQGDGDAALRTAKQALDIYQRLALAKPERFEPDLAMSLSNYAIRLSDQDDGDAALRTAKQALDIYQRLALAKPERFEPDLAMSLSNYAAFLSDQGDGDAALRTAKQALDIRQRLALAKPIARLSIAGFKSIRKLESLRLDKLNILIGTNGSGKSNFVSFFRMLAEMAESRLQHWTSKQGSADRIVTFGVRETQNLSASIEFGTENYQFALTPSVDGGFLFGTETVSSAAPEAGTAWAAGGASQRESRLPGQFQNTANNRAALRCHNAITNWRIFHFHDISEFAGVKRRCALQDNAYLRPDGSNLAAFLYRLAKEAPDVYGQIRRVVRLVVPYFDDFILTPELLPTGEALVQLFWHQKNQDYPLWPSQLSDGSLRFICLATALLQPAPPSTIIIDEPELGLHPHAIAVLGGLLRAAALDMQVIVCTQSVQLVNEFSIDNLIIVENKDGESVFRRLDEAEFAAWLEDFSVGDLWVQNLLESGASK